MSYLASSTAQTTVTLGCSLLFTVLAFWFQQKSCKANVMLNIWYLISIAFGILSFVEGFILTVGTLSLGVSESTTGIIAIWYIFIYLSALQFTSFLNAFGLSLFYAHNHSHCGRVDESLINDGGDTVYIVKFGAKRFLATFGVWLVINIVLAIISYLTGWAIGVY
jgi:hypothetical protein